MRTAETVPAENLEGLSHEQNEQAERLKRNYDRASEIQEDGLKEDKVDNWRGYGYMGFIPAAMERAAESHGVKSARKKATRHYKENETAYQEQAVKDAAAEGVYTDFGTGNRLEGLPGLSHEDNQRAVNLRWEHDSASRHARDLDKRRRQSYHRSAGREINEMIEEMKAHHAVSRIERDQRKHYQQHEGEYQIQAVNDAAAEGIETNFSEK